MSHPRTPTTTRILELAADGWTAKRIAEELHIRRQNVYATCYVHGRRTAHAGSQALTCGDIPIYAHKYQRTKQSNYGHIPQAALLAAGVDMERPMRFEVKGPGEIRVYQSKETT